MWRCLCVFVWSALTVGGESGSAFSSDFYIPNPLPIGLGSAIISQRQVTLANNLRVNVFNRPTGQCFQRTLSNALIQN